MGNEEEQQILATIRTFLALERNLLAEERTELAQFRTGLAIILIIPPAATIVVFISSFLDATLAFVSNSLSFVLFFVFFIWGFRTIISSWSKLTQIRKNKKRLKIRECKFLSKSKTVNGSIEECMIIRSENDTNQI